ncbi:MAG: helix-turn-helix transcriptional regulator [Oscillospiraceae bacterium]|nr:helix-turn-helix transcriptional regulator [Oscillospiraceae bacterium]MDY3218717.1 helix-turn-helix transcriptional regulator [Candidatus Fimivivens sp.]SFI53730.1 DNA-binding transcriptional regulator, XRE-family HTH domain [Ruminococcaceae bacterium D5]
MLRLRYLRERENLSQIEVAKLLNVAPNTLSQYENGRRDPDTNTLIRIANFYNVSLDYLLGRTDLQGMPVVRIVDESIEDMEDFRFNLKRLRTEKNLEQSELAQALGVSQSIISEWETGKKRPDRNSRLAILKFFNVSPSDLFGRSNYYEAEKPATEDGSELPAFDQKLIKILSKLDPEERSKLLDLAELIAAKHIEQPSRKE